MTPLPKLPPAKSPERPHNVLHTISEAINAVVGLPMQAANVLSEGFASATNAISEACPEFPAATLSSMAIGINHAHILHPPSGPARHRFRQRRCQSSAPCSSGRLFRC